MDGCPVERKGGLEGQMYPDLSDARPDSASTNELSEVRIVEIGDEIAEPRAVEDIEELPANREAEPRVGTEGQILVDSQILGGEAQVSDIRQEVPAIAELAVGGGLAAGLVYIRLVDS